VNIKDRVWAERSAAAVIVALRDPTTVRLDYPHLAETLVAVSEHLSPTEAVGYAAQVIGVFLPMLQDRDKLIQVYDPLGQAVVVISPWLDADAAARAAAALGDGIRLTASYSITWASLAKALVAVCRRLPPPDATAHVNRTVDLILEICSAMPEKYKNFYGNRAGALLPLCGRLDEARAARVADAILAILGDNEKLEPNGLMSLTSFAEVLTAVAERLDAVRSLRASEELVRVLRKAKNVLIPPEQLRIALVSAWRRLDAAGAARVAEAVVAAVRDPGTSLEARTVFAGVFVTVGDRLAPAQADSLERALVDSFLLDLADVKSLRLSPKWPLGQPLAAVCGRAGAKKAARAAGAAGALTETICNPQTPIEALPPLVKALVVVGGRLSPEEASSRANRALAALASLWRTRMKPLDRVVLAEALAAAWTGVGPAEAGPHARRVVADLEDLLRDPKLTSFELRRLAEALVAVYWHLGPAERSAHANTLFAAHANTFLAALRNPKNARNLVDVGQFAGALLALCEHQDRPESLRVVDALLTVLSDPDTQQYTLELQKDAIKKVLIRLDEEHLRQILRHPSAVGRLQRLTLDVLGEAKHCSFRNTWDYLDRTR
jgi:hypothetical protein